MSLKFEGAFKPRNKRIGTTIFTIIHMLEFILDAEGNKLIFKHLGGEEGEKYLSSHMDRTRIFPGFSNFLISTHFID